MISFLWMSKALEERFFSLITALEEHCITALVAASLITYLLLARSTASWEGRASAPFESAGIPSILGKPFNCHHTQTPTKKKQNQGSHNPVVSNGLDAPSWQPEVCINQGS